MSAQLHRIDTEIERQNQTAALLDSSDLSDDTLANRLSAERLRGDWLYVHAWRAWMLWTGAQWKRGKKLEHLAEIRDFLRAQAKATKGKDAADLRSARKAYAVEQMVRSNTEVAAAPDQWDANTWLLGTPGGTVELRTGTLRPARRDDHITKLTAVAPAEPGVDAPIWRSFLQRIFRSDLDILPFLQRAAGYALTGQSTEHKLLFAFGTGRNGKGVFFNTLTSILADYATVSSSFTFLESGMNSHPTGIASLAGARLVTASELPPGKPWNESLLKSITGGDPITARRMRQDEFTFKPQFTLMIAGNHMPSFRGVDEATRARVLLIPFKETILADERDPDLAEKLKGEWPAILRWAIDGALDWQNVGLRAPAAVTDASNEYMDDEDVLGEFIGDCLQENPGGFVKTADMYEVFRGWCDKRGMRAPWTQHALRQAMKERGYEFGRKTHGRGVWGCSLRTPIAGVTVKSGV